MTPTGAADSGPRSRGVGAQHRSVRSLLVGGTLLVAAALFVASVLVPLAMSRYVHVDECQLAYNAALLGIHGLPEFVNFHSPLVVPLSWIAARGGASWPRLLEMRAAFLLLFLLDLVLAALFAPRIRGLPARAGALLGLCLVEPFWRHGFEIRHDVLMLACTLGLFALTQRAAAGRIGLGGFALAGALSGWMQMNSFKAFLIWPAAMILLFGASRVTRGRDLATTRAALAAAAGFAAAAAAAFALLASAGLATVYLRGLLSLSSSAMEVYRFAAGARLISLLLELPHLTFLAVVGAVAAVSDLRRREWRSSLPSVLTAAWLILELVALHLNPTPFTYNLIHVIPFLYLAAIDGLGRLFERLRPAGRAILVTTAAAATLTSFVWSWNHDPIGRSSAAPQRQYVEAAEALSGPDDPVLDAAGLVLSRRPPGRDWMLHSLLVPAYRRGERETYDEMLRRTPTPVLLTNYRWEWLGAEDRRLVQDRYVSIAPRLLVLGGRRSGPGLLEIYRPGRYRVSPDSPGLAIAIDGSSVPPAGVVHLDTGEHELSAGAIWAWLGPDLDDFPDPGPLFPSGELFVSD